MPLVCICIHLHSSVYRTLNVRTRSDTNGSLRLDASFVQGLSGCTIGTYARERLSMAYYEVMKFPLFGCEDVYRLSTGMAGIMEGVV